MKNSTWKILKVLTLILPTSVFLFLNAILFNITPDVIVNEDISVLKVEAYEDNYVLYGDAETTIDGYTILYNGVVAAVIDNDDVIKIGFRYYSYVEGEDGFALTELKLIEKQQSYKIPITFFISVLGAMIVILVAMKKMQVLKDHPMEATLISLWVLAISFVIINTIVTSLTSVFVVGAASFTVYYIEDKMQHGFITKVDAEKKQSDIVTALKEALK